MSARALALIAAAGSAALLLGALGFQYLGDLAPCKLCYWQRYPHGVAIGAGLLAFVAPLALVALLGAAAAAVTSGIGIYHVGVEQRWWEGPNTCSSGSVGGLSPSELLDQIMAAPVVRCDEIAWDFLGISMAGWNALISAGLVVLWLLALRAARRAH